MVQPLEQAYLPTPEDNMTQQAQKALDQLLKSMEKPSPEALYCFRQLRPSPERGASVA